MGVGGLLEREGLTDDRRDPALRRLGQRPLGHPAQVAGCELHLLDPAHGHAAAGSLVRVDGREPAARSAVRGEAAPARRDVERGPAELPAGAVEDRVRARPARRIEYPLGPVRLGVVDDDLGAQPPDEVELAPAAGRGDDPPAGRVHELHEEDAETAARGQDEDPLAGPDPGIVDEAERGGAVVQDGGRVEQVEPVRDGDELISRNDRTLDVPVVTAAPAGMGDHTPPERL